MRKSTRGIAIATALGALVAGAAVAPGVASADSSDHRVITVTMKKTEIDFSTGNTFAPGFAVFKVEQNRGQHSLQFIQLHEGYTLKDLKSDIDKAFQGRLKAIHRVDTQVTWLGGADAGTDTPGRFAVNLPEGNYVAIDINGDAYERFHVAGVAVDADR